MKTTIDPKTNQKRKLLLMLALILFVAGIVCLCGPTLVQHIDLMHGEQEYAALVEQVQPNDPMQLPAEDADTDDETEPPEPAIEETVADDSPAEKVVAEESVAEKPIEPVIKPQQQPSEIPSSLDSNNESEKAPTVEPDPHVIGGNTSADLTGCKEKNADFVAWLEIPGTKVNYPVVQSDDTDYYVTHTFNGSKSALGTLFSLSNADYKNGKNIAIYGHHVTGSGEKMFRPLFSYKDKSYWEQHQTIYLDSFHGSRAYKVFAVINLEVDDWDASTASFADTDAFMDFVNRAKDQAMYDTGVAVAAEDRILSLITCDRSYGGKTGRLIVMAVEQ